MYKKLEKLLKKRGESVFRMCENTGICRSSVTAWKQGLYGISDENLNKLCDYFGVKPSYFIKKAKRHG